jgi:hypothetical protein
MGEPSWWVLASLSHHPDGLAPFQMIHRVQDWLKQSDHPVKRLDPGTLHYAIPRMEALGVIEFAGEQEVDVPVGHGATKREKRPLWRITALGELALVRRARFEQVAQPRLLPGLV